MLLPLQVPLPKLPSKSHPRPNQTPADPGDTLELVSAHLDPYDVSIPQFLGVHLKIKVDTCGEGNGSSPSITQQHPVSLVPPRRIGPRKEPSAAAHHPAANGVSCASPARVASTHCCPVRRAWERNCGPRTCRRGAMPPCQPGSSLPPPTAALHQRLPDN